MSDHIPGPWEVCNPAPNSQWNTGLTVGAADPKDARRICDVFQWGVDPHTGVTAANARLIASAPEMLAALKAVRAKCPADPDINADWLAAWQMLEDAIAKAEGAK